MSSYGAGTFIWTGLDTLQAVLHNASPRVTAFLGDAMTTVMDDVYEESQQEVPVATGALRSSGYVDDPEIAPGDIKIQIGYGAPYAWFVHENMAAHHPHGKAKFLEDPLANALADLSRQLQGRLEGAVVGQGYGSGSSDHAQESTTLAASHGRSNRSMSHKGSLRPEHAAEAMRHMRANPGQHEYSTERGKLKIRSMRPVTVRYNYDPTRKGTRGTLHHPG